jgi:hypothetical protein
MEGSAKASQSFALASAKENQIIFASRLRRGAKILLTEKGIFLFASRTCDQKILSQCNPFQMECAEAHSI